MSDDLGEVELPIPEENAPIEWRGFSLAVDFYPPIKTTRKTGLEFSSELADVLEPEDVRLEGKEWRIIGGGVHEGIQMFIGKRNLMIAVSPVTEALERYEHRLKVLLSAFEHRFEPKVALRSNVNATGLVALPGDGNAVAFLGGYVMFMRPSRLDTIDRPPNILGVRINFPPFEGADWNVDVRIESSGEDPNKVFLNADADWDKQSPWDDTFVAELYSRVEKVTSFMSGPLIQFLREPPFPDTEEDRDNE